ncbi:MAG TPA: SufD family Fe-S cluster assembly protein [Candidatus Eisenbacteria bacterium]|nr:SufD family Fe-S cluster assembly protein [Candidatus Eisenbacteria bacterium]
MNTTETPTSIPRARPVRRSPAELPFSFADRGLAQVLAAEREEPDWLRAERLAAWERFEAMPVEGNQLYTPYIDLRGASLADVRPYVRTASVPGPAPRRGSAVSPGSAPATAGQAQLPDGLEGTAGLIELSEDTVTTLVLGDEAAAVGVTLETFGAALARDSDGFRADIEGGSTLPANDKLAMLARGFWSQGVRLVVPDGVRLDRPFLIRWRSSNPDRALITRTIVRLGAGASASLVEEQLASGPPIECAEGETVPQGFFHGTTEVVLGDGASLAMASIQDLPTSQVAFHHRHARIGEAATLRWALAQLGGRLVRSRVDNRLEGDRSSVEQVEIVFGGEEQLFDLSSFTRHIGRDTTGNLLSKGALMDRSRSFMKGLITIEKSAVGTDSFLGEFGMNLSKSARAVAIPSLEIDQPDCRRAMHSSSVGPIDATQLFYLESRGIPPDEARKFIVLGFLEPVVARVSLEAAQDLLRQLLEDKWAAGLAAATAAAA